MPTPASALAANKAASTRVDLAALAEARRRRLEHGPSGQLETAVAGVSTAATVAATAGAARGGGEHGACAERALAHPL